MPSRVILQINSPLSVDALRSLLSDSSTRKRPFAHKVINFFRGLMGGFRRGSVNVHVCDAAAVAASKAGTFSSTPNAADTISINGVTITFVNGTPGNNEVKRDDSPTTTQLATRLAAAINNSTTAGLSGVVSASSNGAVVTVTCNVPGVIGNSITLGASATGFAWAGGATALSGGSGRIEAATTISFS